MANFVGIYKITSPSGRIYIGQSWNILARKATYKSGNLKRQYHLENSLNKYGFENHIFEIIHTLPCDITQKVLDDYEVFYYNQYKELGFNMLNIKEPGSGGKHSKETIEKIRKISSRPENIERMKILQKETAKNRIGLKNTLQTRILMSTSRTGKSRKIEIFNRDGNLITDCYTQSQASEITKVSRSRIANNLCGLSESTKNYIFKYKEIINE